MLANGEVLLAGGDNPFCCSSASSAPFTLVAELYNPPPVNGRRSAASGGVGRFWFLLVLAYFIPVPGCAGPLLVLNFIA